MKIRPAKQTPINGRAEGSGVGVVEAVLQMPFVPPSSDGMKADHSSSELELKVLPFPSEMVMFAGPSPTGRMPESDSLGSL
jgi:hypothetical protein